MHRWLFNSVDRVSGITMWISVPQIALDFSHCVRLSVVSVDEKLSNTLFTMVPGVSDSDDVSLNDVNQQL